jgi:GNAT superfamily N-acetyltransferase
MRKREVPEVFDSGDAMTPTPSTDSMRIRPATEGDLSLVLSLIKDLAEYERMSHEVVATEESLRDWLFGEHAVAEALIAEYDGMPAGFALFFRNFSTFLGRPGIYLEDLFVRPEYRGKGIGKSLLLRLAQIARERGYGRVEWAVLDWNEPAIGFYRSLGARPMEEWTVFRLAGDDLDRAGQSR